MPKKLGFFRLLSILMCCSILFSLLPGTLFVKAISQITSVDVTGVDVPAVGQTPDFSVSVSGDGNCSVADVVWKRLSNGATLSQQDTFKSGDRYELCVTVQAGADYVFRADELGDPLVSATVGGNTADAVSVAGVDAQDCISIQYIYQVEGSDEELPPIHTVSVSQLTIPVVGATADFSVSTPGSTYSVDSVIWTYLNPATGTTVSMTKTDRYKAGGKYRVQIILRADSQHSFAPSVTGSLNGSSIACHAPAGKDPAEYTSIVYEYILGGSEQITDVTITSLVTPTKGARPDFTVSVPSSAHYSVNEISWKKWKSTEAEDSAVAMGTRENFQVGYSYQVSVTLKAKAGYAFATDNLDKPLVSGTINGEPALPGRSVAGKSASQFVRICMNYSLDAKLISTVDVTDVIDPVAGERPNALAEVAPEALYAVSQITWEYWEDTQLPAKFVTLSPYAVFAAGMYYRVNIILRAVADAEFAVDESGKPTVTGTINGTAATVEATAMGYPVTQYICLSYSYPVLKEDVMQVDISGITEPAAGMKPDYEAELAENAPYLVEKITWEYLDTEKTPAEYTKMSPNDKFEANKDYRVTFLVKAGEGGIFYINDFDELQVTATVNGEPTIPAEAVDKKDPREYVSISYDFSLSSDAKLIKRVTVHDLQLPTVGEAPDFSLSTDAIAKYTIDEVVWERLASRQSASAAAKLEKNDVFQEGIYYRVTIILKANDGYAFHTNEVGKPQVTATLNGGAGMAAERITGKDAKSYICIKYVCGVYTVIDGGHGEWSPGKGELKFRFTGDYKNFTAVRIDGVQLSPKYYTASEGSTVIVLSEDFLNTLQDGIYEISVVFTDGQASTKFEVHGGSVSAGEKEGGVSIWVWILPLIIVLMCVMVAVVIILRRKAESKVYEEEYEEYDEDEEE